MKNRTKRLVFGIVVNAALVIAGGCALYLFDKHPWLAAVCLTPLSLFATKAANLEAAHRHPPELDDQPEV